MKTSYVERDEPARGEELRRALEGALLFLPADPAAAMREDVCRLRCPAAAAGDERRRVHVQLEVGCGAVGGGSRAGWADETLRVGDVEAVLDGVLGLSRHFRGRGLAVGVGVVALGGGSDVPRSVLRLADKEVINPQLPNSAAHPNLEAASRRIRHRHVR